MDERISRMDSAIAFLTRSALKIMVCNGTLSKEEAFADMVEMSREQLMK